MNKKVRNIVISSTVIIIIIGILFFNKIRFIDGPTAIYTKIDQQALEKFEASYDFNNLKLVSRYVIDDIVYTAKDNNEYYLFNDESKLLGHIKIDDIDFNQFDIQEEDLIVLSYYDEDIVYVVDNKKIIKVFDLTGSPVLEYEKRLDTDE